MLLSENYYTSYLQAGIVSSGNAWERRSQSYFDSGNGVPRNAINHLIWHLTQL